MKACTKCGVVKPQPEFSRDTRALDGLKSQCRACNRASYALWRASNLHERRANVRAWKAANSATIAAINAKRRAIKRGATTGTISAITWAHLRNECAVFELLTGEPHQIDHKAALAGGGSHSVDNLDVISAVVNASKGATRIEDLRPGKIAWDYFHGPDTFHQVTWRTEMCGKGLGRAPATVP